jgi:hypothetical protein
MKRGHRNDVPGWLCYKVALAHKVQFCSSKALTINDAL